MMRRGDFAGMRFGAVEYAERRPRLGRVTVRAWERAVVERDGVILGELGPGRHRVGRRAVVHCLDLRDIDRGLHGQEVLTADGISLRVNVSAPLRIVDPTAWLTRAADPYATVHTALQLALRSAASALTVEQLLADRTELARRLAEDPGPAQVAASVGAEIGVPAVRDVSLPAEVRAAMTRVLVAREQARADLERARGEAATMRSLANTARLVEASPALLHLRTLQAAGQGATLVVTPPPR